MMRRTLVILYLGLFALACGSEEPTPTPTPAPPVAPCPSGRGPTMVRIPLSEGRSACVDTTEVTRAQYAAFLADGAAHGAGTRLAQCGDAPYRDEPDASCLAEPKVCKGNCDAHPQVCVSHCSAQGFCAWAGKKVCGTLKGVPADVKTLNDARVTPWLAACGGGADELGEVRKPFPYGSALDSTKCNTEGQAGSGCAAAPNSCGTVPAGSLPGCQGEGVYAGIFDMSGNVQEWVGLTDQSASSPIPSAPFRGGSFERHNFSEFGDYTCDASGGSSTINLGAPYIGFRCCAD